MVGAGPTSLPDAALQPHHVQVLPAKRLGRGDRDDEVLALQDFAKACRSRLGFEYMDVVITPDHAITHGGHIEGDLGLPIVVEIAETGPGARAASFAVVARTTFKPRLKRSADSGS